MRINKKARVPKGTLANYNRYLNHQNPGIT